MKSVSNKSSPQGNDESIEAIAPIVLAKSKIDGFQPEIEDSRTCKNVLVLYPYPILMGIVLGQIVIRSIKPGSRDSLPFSVFS